MTEEAFDRSAVQGGGAAYVARQEGRVLYAELGASGQFDLRLF